MASINDYLGRIPDYNSIQPDFMAVLAGILQPLVDLQNFAQALPQQFDLDVAIGTQLDQTGLWIGRSRFISTPIEDVYFSWDVDGLGWEQGLWQG
jgi:hypothetical protein